jgi:membrane protease YdiL (CAAX protease family)
MADHVPTALRPPAYLSPVASFRVRSRHFARRHGRFAAALGIVLALLAAVNVIREFGPSGAGLVVGPVAAAAFLLLARGFGLSWADLGLARRTWRRGTLVALAATAAVAAVYAVAAAVPATRLAFLDSRYQLSIGAAVVTALVVIPLGTVLVEEVAFRGVLQAMVTRHRGVAWGLGVSSALFGAWHILPSLGLAGANPAVAGVTGDTQVLAVLGAVAFTTVAGLVLGELRRRSGSLLAAAGLHWAINGVGVLVAAVLRATGSA